MKIRIVCRVAFLLVCWTCCACTRQTTDEAEASAHNTLKTHSMKTEVTLQLGWSGRDFAIALGREDARISRQPAGLNFYEIHWPDQTSGLARFEHGANGFELTTVLGVMGTEDADRLSAGVYELLISFGLPPRNAIPHDEARLQVMALLKRLQDAGWQQYYYFSQARIKGRSSLKHSSSVDVRYTPTFEEWMAFGIQTVSWKLQANGVYMDISMNRDGDRMNPYQPGAYFMSMTLETEEQYMRSNFSQEDRDNWKELWPEFSKRLMQSRMKKELEARTNGLELDTSYKDPPILALRVPVSTLRVGQPCLQAGLWQASLPPHFRAARLLADAPQRFQRVELGEPMPAIYSSFMFDGADAHNAAITWVLVRAA